VAGTDRFNWRILFYAAIAAIVVMLLLFVYGPDPALDYLFFIVPTGCLAILALLVIVVIRKRTRQSLSMLLAAAVFLFVAGAMRKTQAELRPSLRWGLWSRRLKAQVLAQPSAPKEELKHIEWDGWGGAPVGDWTAYIVYDPTDSLAVEAKAGRSGSYRRLKGIPCEVDSVRRLEAHWYSVVLGMNEWWNRCGESQLAKNRNFTNNATDPDSW
jgi:hypothetical protein